MNIVLICETEHPSAGSARCDTDRILSLLGWGGWGGWGGVAEGALAFTACSYTTAVFGLFHILSIICCSFQVVEMSFLLYLFIKHISVCHELAPDARLLLANSAF